MVFLSACVVFVFLSTLGIWYTLRKSRDSPEADDVGSRSSVGGRQASTNVKRRKRERYHDGRRERG